MNKQEAGTPRTMARKVKRNVLNFRWRVLNRLGSTHQCYLCKKTFQRFRPYRGGLDSLSSFIQKIGLVGSDVVNFECPFCRSNDRERHLFLYFDRLRLWDAMAGSEILHFAPERKLSDRIRSMGPKRYVKADLYPADLFSLYPDVERMDVTNIPYPPDSFDFLICNHVLEHVADERKALSEIHRVLRKGGRAILQTPFSTVLKKTFQDPGIDSDELRIIAYGQEDHARLFGLDFLERISESGLTLKPCRHLDVATLEEASYYGMNPREDLILAQK